jgi:hypothetical protein
VNAASGVQAWFDLSEDPRWLLGREIARVQLEGELVRIVSAELLAEAPAGPEVVDIVPVGDDWVVAFAPVELARPLAGAGSWSLVLVDVERLASARFVAEQLSTSRVRVLGAERFARAAAARDGASGIAWSLEYRSGAVTLHRSSGRRAP